jgi:putative endonuclease
MEETQYYVYFLTNLINTVLYTGVTNNLVRRIYEHKNHAVSGFTAKYNVTKLVYYENFSDAKSAILREKQIKGGSRADKMKLIMKENPKFIDLYEQICG